MSRAIIKKQPSGMTEKSKDARPVSADDLPGGEEMPSAGPHGELPVSLFFFQFSHQSVRTSQSAGQTVSDSQSAVLTLNQAA